MFDVIGGFVLVALAVGTRFGIWLNERDLRKQSRPRG